MTIMVNYVPQELKEREISSKDLIWEGLKNIYSLNSNLGEEDIQAKTLRYGKV